jgi:hypothetical protein
MQLNNILTTSMKKATSNRVAFWIFESSLRQQSE